MKPFNHEALHLSGKQPLVYTALSKNSFYYRMHISQYVLKQGKVPLNPFLLFDYFLLDTVERDVVRDANNSLVLRADEIWVFGPISNGVLAEILLAKREGKPLSYFKLGNAIEPILEHEVIVEEEINQYKNAFK